MVQNRFPAALAEEDFIAHKHVSAAQLPRLFTSATNGRLGQRLALDTYNPSLLRTPLYLEPL